MEIPKYIKEAVKGTVGYSEAENKHSFMAGCMVAFRKSEDYFESQIKTLTNQLEMQKRLSETVTKDIKTLVGIISKYQDNE